MWRRSLARDISCRRSEHGTRLLPERQHVKGAIGALNPGGTRPTRGLALGFTVTTRGAQVVLPSFS
jgi:hypothetical protein